MVSLIRGVGIFLLFFQKLILKVNGGTKELLYWPVIVFIFIIFSSYVLIILINIWFESFIIICPKNKKDSFIIKCCRLVILYSDKRKIKKRLLVSGRLLSLWSMYSHYPIEITTKLMTWVTNISYPCVVHCLPQDLVQYFSLVTNITTHL